MLLVQVLKEAGNGWLEGELQSRGKKRAVGWFPANRVEFLPQRNQNASSSISLTSPSHSISSTHNYSSAPELGERAKSVSCILHSNARLIILKSCTVHNFS